MKRTTAGTIVAVASAVLLVIALASSRWWIAFDDDAREQTLAGLAAGGALGGATWLAGLALVVLAPAMIASRSRWLCAVGIAVAFAALVGASWVAIEASAKVRVGPVAITWSVGAAGMLAAAMLLMAPAHAPPTPPPHDGRRLVYDDAGVLVAVEHYEGGVLRRTDRIGADGLVASDR